MRRPAIASWILVPWQRLSLTVKAVLLLLSVIVVVGAVSYAFFSPLVDAAFEDEVSRRGNAMVRILEGHQDVQLALALRDHQAARRVAQEVLNGDPGTRYVMLLDSQNDVLGFALSDQAQDQPGAMPAIEERIRANVTAGESLDGDVHRFVQAVDRSEKQALDHEPAPGSMADKAQPESKVIGRIILGLSASTARRNISLLTVELIATVGVSLLVVFVLFFNIQRRRLFRIIHFAELMAGGNLTERMAIEDADEIGRLSRALEEMRDRMGSMVIRLQDAALSLTLASTEILESSSQQSRNASLQAASVTETGATMAELKEIFAQASERAQSVIDLAKKSEDSTTSGRTAVQESVEAMEQIRDEVTHISSTIVGLVERTNQIAVIIDTVNDLAEQSNVLALNAAIEAARAGEHGKGFAVVAREVRSLAKRSKDSTAQVRSILTDIEKASRDAMAVIEEGTRKTQSGMELSSRAGQSIIHLDQAIDASSTAAKQIAASIRQQSLGMEQIWQAMRDVGRSVQESVAGVQALESSSKTMKDLSEEMSELTSAYQVSRRTGLGNSFGPSMPTEPPLARTEPPRARTRTQPGRALGHERRPARPRRLVPL